MNLSLYITMNSEAKSERTITIIEANELLPITKAFNKTPEQIKTTTKYYNVPLSEDLQTHIFNQCKQYGISPALVVAVIQKESRFTASAIGDSGNSLGLMQIQPRWHQSRMGSLGCTNLLDPYQNITVGVNYLADLFASGKSTEWVLMAYNGGPSYANSKTSAGVVSDYARTVLSSMKALENNMYEVGGNSV